MHDARDRNAGIWIEHNDRLYIAAYSSVASLSVMFSGYFRKENGEIQEYAVSVNPTSDRAVTASSVYFGAGFLLSCVATLASGNANRGQCYVRAQIQRSTGTPAIKLHGILGGYVTDDYSPSFPYGKIEGSLEGQGFIRNFAGTNPAAGAEISEAVPTGARWRLLAINFLLETNGSAADRYVALDLVASAGSMSSVSVATAQVASTLFGYFFAIGIDRALIVPAVLYTLPIQPALLMAGFLINTYTVGLTAGDNFTAPVITVEEWIEA